MPWVHQLSRASIKRRGVLPWAVALLLFATSLAARLVLPPVLIGLAFITFYPAIVVATLICGWQQGTLVVLLSVLAGWYFFLEPTSTFASKDAAAIGIFLFAGGSVVLVVAALRETIRRVEAAKAMQETLFRELQHRVANNLQLVVALLRNAQRNLRNPDRAKETLTEAEERILAMSHLHRRLTDGTAYATGLEPILKEMLAHVFQNLPVKVTVDAKGASDLSIDQMTAITLLVNEAALNAAKHVFSKGLGSQFGVSLANADKGCLHLSISDDGPGLPPQTADRETKSLGMDLMEAFATQLGGSLEVGQSSGLSLNVDFKPR